MSLREEVNLRKIEREEDCCNAEPAAKKYLSKTFTKVEPVVKDDSGYDDFGLQKGKEHKRKHQELPNCLQNDGEGGGGGSRQGHKGHEDLWSGVKRG